jgi:hypothetical protein
LLKSHGKNGEIFRIRIDQMASLFFAEGWIMLKRRIGLAILIGMLSGCAHDAWWMQDQEPVHSTIRNDPNKAPAGKVIPPPGMGVDLGQSHSISDKVPLA